MEQSCSSTLESLCLILSLYSLMLLDSVWLHLDQMIMQLPQYLYLSRSSAQVGEGLPVTEC